MSKNTLKYNTRVKVDFHLHTRGDKEFHYNGGNFVSDYVQALCETDVKVGAITNHNKFELKEFKALRKYAKRFNIVLLPGVEFEVKDGKSGIHILIVFSDEWIYNIENIDFISKFLNSVFDTVPYYKNENLNSDLDIRQTVGKLNGYGKDYFLIFAHVEDEKGLWKELKPGRIKKMFDDPIILERILAFQKVCSKAKVFKQVLGNNYLSEVEGSDPKCIEDITNKNVKPCYLKLGELSFEAVKFALSNKDWRVTKRLYQPSHSYISNIVIEGAGILGGTEVKFSPELNSLIGIRGSGKSSIIETIRYGLNIPLGDGSSDSDYKNRLVKFSLLGGGKITIEAVNQHGQSYQISRILGQSPDVFINGVLQPGLSIIGTVLSNPIYFGQKDILSSAEGFEKDLIEKLVGDDLTDVRQRIDKSCRNIINRIKEIRSISLLVETKEDLIRNKQDLEHRLKIFKKYGIDVKLKKQIDYEQDERKLEQLLSIANDYLAKLSELITNFDKKLKEPLEYISIHNQSFFTDFLKNYRKLVIDFSSLPSTLNNGSSIVKELTEKVSNFRRTKSTLKEEFADIERRIEIELQNSGVVKIDPNEYKEIEKKLNHTVQSLSEVEENSQKYQDLNHRLEQELNKFHNHRIEEFQIIRDKLDIINRSKSPLKFEVQFMADKDATLIFIQDLFRGSKIHKSIFEKIINCFDDFREVWREKNRVKDELGSSFDKFWEYFNKYLIEFLTWQIPHNFSIKYHDKIISTHSLGQRASALILFILNRQENDIVIIDQPEDDLDNQTLYEDVIKLIQEKKSKTQFIFATHNPNIPVLGDAEQIVVCEYLGEKIKVKCGGIDHPDIQKYIINIMEGGKEAFEKRNEVYSTWMR